MLYKFMKTILFMKTASTLLECNSQENNRKQNKESIDVVCISL